MTPLAIAYARPTLLTLPQELQEAIFDLAYPPVTVTYIHRARWQTRESSRRRADRSSNYVKRPFPSPVVGSFLVSKAFFVAAARAWAGGQNFQKGIEFAEARSVSPRDDLEGIVAAFATRVALEADELSWLADLPRLRVLTIMITEMLFYCIEDEVSVETDVLGDEHFHEVLQANEELTELKELGRDVTVHLQAEVTWSRIPASVWEANVASFEVYRREHVLKSRGGQGHKPETKCQTTQDPQAIYRNYAVSFCKSELGANQSAEEKSLASESEGEDHTLFDHSGIKINGDNKDLPVLLAQPVQPLTDDDIPERVEDLAALLMLRGPEVMGWIRGAKLRPRTAIDEATESKRVSPQVTGGRTVMLPSSGKLAVICAFIVVLLALWWMGQEWLFLAADSV